MLRIVTHIEYLLLEHDCVIVPGFGGFVLQTLSARYDADAHTFYPSRKEMVFNATLQHNDGLLSESYMQRYGADYRKALGMLEEDTCMLKETLLQQKQLSMGQIGAFSMSNEGQPVFQPSNSRLFSTASYGLETFSFPTLASCAAREVAATATKQTERDVLYIPVSRRLIRTLTAAAAAIALLLIISTPVKEVNKAAYTAGFIPTELASYRTVGVTPPTRIDSEGVLPKVENSSAPALAVAKPTPTVPAITPAPTTASPSKPAAVAERAKYFHLVIASFPTEAQADQYMNRVRPQCAQVDKVKRDGKYRVYADRFESREQAEGRLATLRGNANFKDAWLFISR